MTDAYAIHNSNGIVTNVIMCDDLETAKSFLGSDAILIEDWAEVGWKWDGEKYLRPYIKEDGSIDYVNV